MTEPQQQHTPRPDDAPLAPENDAPLAPEDGVVSDVETAAGEPLPMMRLVRAGLAPLMLAAGVGGVRALEMARSRFQQSRLFVPTRHPHGEWDPSAYGMDFEDIDFESDDGTRLHGWWMPVRGATSTLVYCHGNSGSIGDRLPVYQRLLALLRINLFAFDYRGYGRSEGVPTERGVLADARAAVDWVRAERDAVPERTLLLGHSMGGAVAVDTALQREVAGLIVQSSFTQLRDMARVKYPDLPLHWITRNSGFSSIEKVSRLEMPKLFVHGTDDETVPFDHGVRLWRAASAPKAFLTLRRARHNDLHVRGSLLYHSALRRFHRACLGRECMDRFTASLQPPESSLEPVVSADEVSSDAVGTDAVGSDAVGSEPEAAA